MMRCISDIVGKSLSSAEDISVMEKLDLFHYEEGLTITMGYNGYSSPPHPQHAPVSPPQNAQPVFALPCSLRSLWVWPLPWRGVKNPNVGTQFFQILSTQGQNAYVATVGVFSSSVVEFLPAHMGGQPDSQPGQKTSGDAGVIPGSGGSPE